MHWRASLFSEALAVSLVAHSSAGERRHLGGAGWEGRVSSRYHPVAMSQRWLHTCCQLRGQAAQNQRGDGEGPA